MGTIFYSLHNFLGHYEFLNITMQTKAGKNEHKNFKHFM